MDTNTLFYGDNLQILSEYIPDESVDLIYLEPPSREMITEAVSAGFYHSELWQQKYPRIQILTIEEILDGKTVEMPPAHGTFKQAQRVRKSEGKQPSLGI